MCSMCLCVSKKRPTKNYVKLCGYVFNIDKTNNLQHGKNLFYLQSRMAENAPLSPILGLIGRVCLDNGEFYALHSGDKNAERSL